MLSNQIRAEAEQMQKQVDVFIKDFEIRMTVTPADVSFLSKAVRRLANMLAREAGGRD
jgi:hypothetical protein